LAERRKRRKKKKKNGDFLVKDRVAQNRSGRANWGVIIEKVIIHSCAVDKANSYLPLPPRRSNILIVGSLSRDFPLIALLFATGLA